MDAADADHEEGAGRDPQPDEQLPPHSRLLPPPDDDDKFFAPPLEPEWPTSPSQRAGWVSGNSSSLEEAQALQRALLESMLSSLPMSSDLRQSSSSIPESLAASSRPATAPRRKRSSQSPNTCTNPHVSTADTPSGEHARAHGDQVAQEAGTCRSSIGTAVDEHEGSGAGGAVAAGMDCGGTKKASAGASNTDDSEGGDKTLLTLKSGETCHAEQVEGLLLKEIPALDGALVVGEGQRYLACLLNLRTKESKGGKRGGSAQLHDCALAAAASVASDATTVKAAYFCDKFRGYLLEGITRCNLELQRMGADKDKGEGERGEVERGEGAGTRGDTGVKVTAEGERDKQLCIKRFVVVPGKLGPLPRTAAQRTELEKKNAKAIGNLFPQYPALAQAFGASPTSSSPLSSSASSPARLLASFTSSPARPGPKEVGGARGWGAEGGERGDGGEDGKDAATDKAGGACASGYKGKRQADEAQGSDKRAGNRRPASDEAVSREREEFVDQRAEADERTEAGEGGEREAGEGGQEEREAGEVGGKKDQVEGGGNLEEERGRAMEEDGGHKEDGGDDSGGWPEGIAPSGGAKDTRAMPSAPMPEIVQTSDHAVDAVDDVDVGVETEEGEVGGGKMKGEGETGERGAVAQDDAVVEGPESLGIQSECGGVGRKARGDVRAVGGARGKYRSRGDMQNEGRAGDSVEEDELLTMVSGGGKVTEGKRFEKADISDKVEAGEMAERREETVDKRAEAMRMGASEAVLAMRETEVYVAVKEDSLRERMGGRGKNGARLTGGGRQAEGGVEAGGSAGLRGEEGGSGSHRGQEDDEGMEWRSAGVSGVSLSSIEDPEMVREEREMERHGARLAGQPGGEAVRGQGASVDVGLEDGTGSQASRGGRVAVATSRASLRAELKRNEGQAQQQGRVLEDDGDVNLFDARNWSGLPAADHRGVGKREMLMEALGPRRGDVEGLRKGDAQASSVSVTGAASSAGGRGRRAVDQREQRLRLDEVASPHSGDPLANAFRRGVGADMPEWARRGGCERDEVGVGRGEARAGGAAVGAETSGGERGGVGHAGAGDSEAEAGRLARAQANLAEGEQSQISEGRWATEEAFGYYSTRNMSKFDRIMHPAARARFLFMFGVFVPVLLLPNIVLHFNSRDAYIRKYARFSLVALVLWVIVGAMWFIIWQAEQDGASATQGSMQQPMPSIASTPTPS